MGILGLFTPGVVDAEPTPQPTPPPPGWKVESVCRDNRGRVLLALIPPPDLLAEAAEPLRAAGADAAAELRQTEAAQALLRQRGLLLDTRDALATAQAAVAQARVDRLAAIAAGNDPGSAEAALRQALVDAEIAQERIGLLIDAIAARERETDEVWNAMTTSLLQRMGQQARERMAQATAALAAEMPSALTEAVAAMQLGLAVQQSWVSAGEYVPHRPLGATPRPPAPSPEPNPLLPSVERHERGEIRPIHCPKCMGGVGTVTDHATGIVILQCGLCGREVSAAEIPQDHPLVKFLAPA